MPIATRTNPEFKIACVAFVISWFNCNSLPGKKKVLTGEKGREKKDGILSGSALATWSRDQVATQNSQLL